MNALFAIALLLASQAAVEVRVTTVDERQVVGTISDWNAEALSLIAADGAATKIPLAEVLRVDSATRRAVPPVSASEVALVDGSRISLLEFSATKGRANFEANVVSGDDGPLLEAPLAAVRSVRLMEMPSTSSTIADDWRDLLAMQPAGDLIVIRKQGAPNLNFVEGTLGNVSQKSVQFTLDGQTLEVKRSKVFGLVYYRNPDNSKDSPAAVVTAPGLRLPAAGVRLNDDMLAVITSHLGVVNLPLSVVDSVDYSVDRLQYLSDLEPVRIDWTPTASLAPTAPLFSNVARDRSFYSPELTLEYPAHSPAPTQVGSSGLSSQVTFSKGLAIRSRTEVTYRVTRGFPTFRATVGIDPLTRTTGAVELIVLGDGQQLYRQTITGRDPPAEVECNVQGVRELTLVVDFGPDSHFAVGTGDNLHLGGARFTK